MEGLKLALAVGEPWCKSSELAPGFNSSDSCDIFGKSVMGVE